MTTHSVVNTEECCGAVGEMADHHPIGLSSVLVHNDNVCEIVVSACLHELTDDL